MKKSGLACVGLFGFLLSAAVGWGAEEPAGQGERAARTLESVMVRRITEELKLTDEQLAKFRPVYQESREVMKAQRRKRRDALEDLRALLRKDDCTTKELEAKLDELDQIHNTSLEAHRKAAAELKNILTVEQRAKFVLAEERIAQDIMKALKNKMGKGKINPRGVER